MTALAADRTSVRREGKYFSDPCAAAVKFYQGAIVVLDAAGNAKPGVTALNLKARGVAVAQVDNSTGAAGDQIVPAEKGVFALKSDGTLTRANLESTVYIVDDQTVAATDGTGTRSAAGKLVDLDGTNAFVLFV